MSEVIKSIAELQEKKVVHVSGYRRNRRTGLDLPIYSLALQKNRRMDVHSLLAGVTSERLVEYDFVARNLLSRNKNATILDIGAGGSGLARAISEHRKNWRVLGVDLQRGSDVQMDARALAFREGTFDQVLSVSAIEHIDNLPGDVSGDETTMREIKRVMKPGARAIVTVPYGKGLTDDHRVYNRRSLAKLVRPFVVARMEFFAYKKGSWRRCSQQVADRANPPVPLYHNAACACLLLVKPFKNAL